MALRNAEVLLAQVRVNGEGRLRFGLVGVHKLAGGVRAHEGRRIDVCDGGGGEVLPESVGLLKNSHRWGSQCN